MGDENAEDASRVPGEVLLVVGVDIRHGEQAHAGRPVLALRGSYTPRRGGRRVAVSMHEHRRATVQHRASAQPQGLPAPAARARASAPPGAGRPEGARPALTAALWHASGCQVGCEEGGRGGGRHGGGGGGGGAPGRGGRLLGSPLPGLPAGPPTHPRTAGPPP